MPHVAADVGEFFEAHQHAFLLAHGRCRGAEDTLAGWNVFRHVTIPNMLPVIVVVMILTILGSMQVFVLILSMVSQGLGYHTEVPVTRILASMTGTKAYGYACAQGVVFGLILVGISFILKQMSNKMKQV